jgi:hypothetical protein
VYELALIHVVPHTVARSKFRFPPIDIRLTSHNGAKSTAAMLVLQYQPHWLKSKNQTKIVKLQWSTQGNPNTVQCHVKWRNFWTRNTLDRAGVFRPMNLKLNASDRPWVECQICRYACVTLHTLLTLWIMKRFCRCQWPRRLRRGSAASRLLELLVRIPPGYWCLSVVSVVCCQERDLCDELITGSEESYRLCVF